MSSGRTREELEQATADAEAWLDALDPAETPAVDVSGMSFEDAVKHARGDKDEEQP